VNKFPLMQHFEILESVCSTAHVVILVMSLHSHTANILTTSVPSNLSNKKRVSKEELM
jgi:hypothetical protein